MPAFIVAWWWRVWNGLPEHRRYYEIDLLREVYLERQHTVRMRNEVNVRRWRDRFFRNPIQDAARG